MRREQRLLPLPLPLLWLVGYLSVVAFLPLAASAQTQTPPCGEPVIDFGYIQVSGNPEGTARYFFSCSWRLLSKFSDAKVSLQLYGFELGSWFDSFTIYDERNVGKSYTGYQYYLLQRRKVILGKSGTLTFTSYRINNSTEFIAHLESINLTSSSQCQASTGYWCTFSQRCISRDWLCDKIQDCALGEDENACFSTTTSTSTTTVSSTSTTTATSLMSSSQCEASTGYWCTSSQRCISRDWLCDKIQDCALGEDENACFSTTTRTSTTATTSTSTTATTSTSTTATTSTSTTATTSTSTIATTSMSTAAASTNVLAIWLPMLSFVVILAIIALVIAPCKHYCKLKHRKDSQRSRQVFAESHQSVASTGTVISSGIFESPSPAQRASLSDLPQYSDLANSCRPNGLEAEEPPAYDTVCEHGLAICTQAKFVVVSSTSDPPSYSHLVSSVK